MNRKLISLCMAMVMILSLCSVTAFATAPAPQWGAETSSNMPVGGTLRMVGTSDGLSNDLFVRVMKSVDGEWTTAFSDAVKKGDTGRRTYDGTNFDLTYSFTQEALTAGKYLLRINLNTIDTATGQPKFLQKEFVVYEDTTSGGGGSGSISTPTPAPTDDGKFTDLAGYEWANDAIYSLVDEGVLNGYGDKTFKPGENVTRAEFSKMIANAFQLTLGSYAVNFSDVTSQDWYAESLKLTSTNLIVRGYEDNTFRGDDPITREELCAITIRTMKHIGVDVPAAMPAFADNDDVSTWAKPDVGSLAYIQVIQGKGENIFAPQDNANRAEAAKIVYGALMYARQASTSQTGE